MINFAFKKQYILVKYHKKSLQIGSVPVLARPNERTFSNKQLVFKEILKNKGNFCKLFVVSLSPVVSKKGKKFGQK